MPTKRLVGTTLALVILSLVLVSYLSYQWASSATETLPDPNGYTQLRQAAIAMQNKDVPEDYEAIDTAELEYFLQDNKAHMQLMRSGLTLPTAVPVQYDANWINRHLPVLTGLRQLARTLQIESAIHRRRGELDQAVQAGRDMLKLGTATQQGGLLIDYLVGAAIDHLGMTTMTNMLDQLTGEHCLELETLLAEKEKMEEPIEAVIQRDKKWSVKSQGFVGYVRSIIAFRALNPSASFTQTISEHRLGRRKFRVKLAARAFELKHGRSPTNAAELVPAFLQTIPKDPFTDQPLNLPPYADE